jgi:histidinol-phosphate aminotransferase
MTYVGVPLAEDFSLDLEAMLSAIEQHQPAVVFLAYPNNPTGNLFDEQAIEQIIKAAPGVVVIDEAYHAFADSSYMSHVMDYDNVLVMRTVSKMGLAGLRLGLLAGAPEWLNEFEKVRLPYNINILTQLSVEFALEHKTVLEAQTDLIKSERSKLFKSLSGFKSFKVFPSSANFILLRTEENQASSIFEALKKERILIKNLDKAGGMLKDCLRITVGTEAENNQLITALKNIVE